MSQWKLEVSEEAQRALGKVVLQHPHLKGLIEQRIQALLAFPPDRWFRVHHKRTTACFYPEAGQKVRLTGWVDFKAHRLLVTRFSLRP